MATVDGSGLDLPTGTAPPVDVRAERRRRRREFLQALVRSKTFLVGFAILLFWVLDAMFWRVIAPHNPQAVTPAGTLKAPSGGHWFGTDNLGRDVFSRVLAGSETVLLIAPAATALGIAGGTAVGLVTGFYRGWVDDVVSRIVDAFLAFPLIVMAVLVLASLGRDTRNVIVVIGIISPPLVARTVRSAVLEERERESVAAARLRGERGLRIMAWEILPNISGPILVEATVRLGYAIFTAATLSFLGLGLQDPSPDWGLTIADGRALRRAAAAGDVRDGARHRPRPPRPGRAHHRARRHRRGGGARPGRGIAKGVQHRDPVRQPQPRHRGPHVRACRRPLRRPADRGGAGPRPLPRSATPLHAGAPALRAPAGDAQGHGPPRPDPGVAAAARDAGERMRVRRPLPDRSRAVRAGAASARPGGRRAHRPVLLLLRGSGHPAGSRRAAGNGLARPRRGAAEGGGPGEGIPGLRDGGRRGRGRGRRGQARPSAGARGRVGQRQDLARQVHRRPDRLHVRDDRLRRDGREQAGRQAQPRGPPAAADGLPEPGQRPQPQPQRALDPAAVARAPGRGARPRPAGRAAGRPGPLRPARAP